uniref:JmjC domain-containing protein n=1 Tax=Aplanochytrium stocchinoi TaxID=215587 RepID=A0A7S3LS38_9STRA|mmetsp:Transcript_37201/g.46539  ORF Transcript_37201/g.46539 Transcript_37201/m.46539 type:complete len:531 (+) Transcript_37201:195-1787(+)|eukprot:CAMPEP_0204844054 /NCGR_PEP_ID=MMETSP1346-20131115/48339_1 /ASSEMBLY_ACC=CAM_ASM_000771 /TAXON_ID=215587 /ORGANISM="Aplanochytrium stocchinoi, Strain GSBS06" /LENGTH=530 /DNA_ID=CAMNT_0051983299 /DNA_START=163 /DNA_END=1755 /DNA_ORIENTATION=-
MKILLMFFTFQVLLGANADMRSAYKKMVDLQAKSKQGSGPPHYLHPGDDGNREIVESFSKFALEFSRTHHILPKNNTLLVEAFCKNEWSSDESEGKNIKGCTWFEVTVLFHSLVEAGASSDYQLSIEDLWIKPTEMLMNKKRVDSYGSSCRRVKNPSMEEFFSMVLHSEPVIIEDAIDGWDALNKWDLNYLRDQVGNTTVIVYSSDDGKFEKVATVHELSMLPDYLSSAAEIGVPMDIENDLNELLIVRPGESEVTFSQFVEMVQETEKEKSMFPDNVAPILYLQKHALSKWFTVNKNIREDILPNIGDGWSDFLMLDHHLLWLGVNTSDDTVAPMHYDEFENLHAVVKGNKRFELFHPRDNSNLYYESSTKYRSLHLIFEWQNKSLDLADKEGPSGRFYRLPYQMSTATLQPFSPVDIDNPDFKKHPNFLKATKMTCDIGKGDTLFIPSNWWHRVTSTPDKDSGISLGINYFYKPMWRMGNDMQHFSHDRAYDHLTRVFNLNTKQGLKNVVAKDRWRNPVESETLKEEL